MSGRPKTTAKRIELELARERDFTSAILDTVGALVVVLDRNGRIVRFNRSCERVTGYSFEAVRGRAVWEVLILPEESAAVQEVFGSLIAGQFPNEHENYWIAKDGRRRLIAWSNTALVDSSGMVQHVIATGIDVTDRRWAEEELRRQAERLEAVAEASRDFSSGLDYRATLDTVARRVGELIGDACVIRLISDDGEWLDPVACFHRDPARDVLLRETIAQSRERAFEGFSASVLQTGKILRLPSTLGEGVVPAGNGHWPHLEAVSGLLIAPLIQLSRVVGHLTLVRETGGQPYTREDEVLLSDLASRAGQAIENARVYADARAAIAARDEFLSIASHELRTPLAALRLAVQNMSRVGAFRVTPPSAPSQARILATAERASRRLEKLVSVLLDVSRIDVGRLHLDVEETDLAAIAAEVETEFEGELTEAQCELLSRLDSAHGVWDRFRIAQAMRNLLDNAIKYGQGRPIEMTVWSEGGRASFSIRDHGIGIALEKQGHIFERFERGVSSRNYGGLGLGLYIVKRIVEAHGGTVGFESEQGRGSTFTVTLPCRPDAHDSHTVSAHAL
jgi:PAS domain S-box-containing protein